MGILVDLLVVCGIEYHDELHDVLDIVIIDAFLVQSRQVVCSLQDVYRAQWIQFIGSYEVEECDWLLK